MSQTLLPADPQLPQLRIAGDPERMREVFATHLRPVGGESYEFRSCAVSRIRYRRADRCFLQYTLRLVDLGTGRERTQWVTGAVYAQKDRAERICRRLWLADSMGEIPAGVLSFDPVSFIPDLEMLVQVFPYDRRLPSLPRLMTGPPPELRPLLLAEFGAGDWRAGSWEVEPVRYREQLGAVLRYDVRAQDAANGRTPIRRFYVKVYPDDKGEQTYRTLAQWPGGGETREEGFTVGRPIAYLHDQRALVLEEAPGTSLDRVLIQGRGVTTAVRSVAQALAAFNRGRATAWRQSLVRDQIAAIERARRILDWACPQLKTEVDAVTEAVTAGLEETPLGPSHLDVKPDHVFLDGDDVVFIDLDSFAAADPVRDPAHLLAHLAAMPTPDPATRDRVRSASQAFTEEYFAHVPRAWRSRFPVHYAGALLETAPSLFRRQEPDWLERIVGLVTEARTALESTS